MVPMEAGANSAAASDEEDIEEKEEGEEEMAGEMELGAMGGEEGAQGGGLAEGGDGVGAKEMGDEGKVEGATAMPGAMEGGEIGVGSKYMSEIQCQLCNYFLLIIRYNVSRKKRLHYKFH